LKCVIDVDCNMGEIGDRFLSDGCIVEYIPSEVLECPRFGEVFICAKRR